MPTTPRLKSAAEIAAKFGCAKITVHHAIKRLKSQALASGDGKFSLGTYEKNRLMFSDDEIALIKSAMVGSGKYEGNSRPRSAPPTPSTPLAKAKPTKRRTAKGAKRAKRK